MIDTHHHQIVFVLNEIAAHAEGARFYDPRVDTIFEIGGQDARYIRLEDGPLIDCAMNEACSAGTGSFIEEQGQRFSGICTVDLLGMEAIAADWGVSLGQHCSVFMAEVIGQAVAAGVDQRSIIAGLYDSIIQNYLHRVKGNRSVGKVVFCQGMPFAADALAAAVARRTGSEVIIPPNPGTVGALGVALLARRALRWTGRVPLDPNRFLSTQIAERATFTCKSTRGCGGAGNLCRIDSIRTLVAGKQQRFVWGGACSLYDNGSRKKKLPDRSPDPFREREELVRELISPYTKRRGFKTVSLTEEFVLRGMIPFYVAYFHELGLDPLVIGGGDYAALKRGIHNANIPFCAPMQLYHGMAGKMAEENAEYLFLPMLRGISRNNGERDAKTCPIIQGSADILKLNLRQRYHGKIISPVIDIGHGNLQSRDFVESCERLAGELGIQGNHWRTAYESAVVVQHQFEERCLEIGSRALAFCAERGLAAIIVLGRPYTIYNRVLNSNVPAILREQGMLAMPLDCYPVGQEVPTFDGMYWGYGQKILRAAHQIRRTAGIYGVYCSNYSCGPDSFNLHFFSYIMEGKPFAVIETDGHSGDAGTKTRIEAFLYCVAEDREGRNNRRAIKDFSGLQVPRLGLVNVQQDECILIPRLGPGSDVAAVAMRGLGWRAEILPVPDTRTLELGRRHTSGKECAPMCLALGSLLGRLEAEKTVQTKFVFMMPGGRGPCRFGVYNLLNQLILDRLELRGRVRMYSPQDSNYFQDTPPGFSGLVFSGFVATDLLLAALLDVRPREIGAGSANAIYTRYSSELLALIEREAATHPSLSSMIWQITSGRLFGLSDLLREAAAAFAGVRGETEPPTVAVVGEVYVRLNPFANDFLIEKLEERGIRARLAPLSEWLEYTDYLGRLGYSRHGFSDRFRSAIQRRIIALCANIFAAGMGSRFHNPVPDSLEAAGEYLRKDLWGEAVLTLGYAISERRNHHIDGIVNLGPLECMPTKISEAQFFHFAEQHKAPVLTLPLDGQSLDPQSLDNFAFEIHSRHQCRTSQLHQV